MMMRQMMGMMMSSSSGLSGFNSGIHSTSVYEGFLYIRAGKGEICLI